MQEDFAGLRRAGLGTSYATCAECGSVMIRQSASATEAGLNDDARSEFTEICPECERLDRQGERPIAAGREGS
jgi:hypothetical protein